MSGLMLEAARRLIDRAMAKAKQDFGRPVCVAVCDVQGFLVAFTRMEGAPVRSIRISQGKAYTAARMGVSTEAVLARLKKEGIEIGYFCDPELTALPGGSPLKNATGAMLGGVGVSGLTSAEDQIVTDFISASVLSGSES
jgi:glc operon protein GlcG